MRLKARYETMKVEKSLHTLGNYSPRHKYLTHHCIIIPAQNKHDVKFIWDMLLHLFKGGDIIPDETFWLNDTLVPYDKVEDSE